MHEVPCGGSLVQAGRQSSGAVWQMVSRVLLEGEAGAHMAGVERAAGGWAGGGPACLHQARAGREGRESEKGRVV